MENEQRTGHFEASSNVHLTKEDQMSITGFTYSDWKQYNEWYEEPVLWLYYTRNSYNLRFENCQPMDPESIKLRQNCPQANLPEIQEDLHM